MARSSSESTLQKDALLIVLALLTVSAIGFGLGGLGSLFGLVWLFGSVVVTVTFLYLLYRLVLAGERIAAAQERQAHAAEVGTDLESSDHDATGESTLDDFGPEDDPDSATDSGGD